MTSYSSAQWLQAQRGKYWFHEPNKIWSVYNVAVYCVVPLLLLVLLLQAPTPSNKWLCKETIISLTKIHFETGQLDYNSVAIRASAVKKSTANEKSIHLALCVCVCVWIEIFRLDPFSDIYLFVRSWKVSA